MKKIFQVLWILGLGLAVVSPLWAEDGTPEPNPAASAGAPPPPPLPDLGQLDLPSPPGTTDSVATPTQVTQPAPAIVPVAPPPPLPTAAPISRIQASPLPSPTPVPAVSSQVPMGGIADYFPWTQGKSLSYEYLKPVPGSRVKRTRRVECLDQRTMPNGTIHYTLKTIEGAKVVRNRYSLYDNEVEHTFEGNRELAGHVILKLPGDGQPVEWKMKAGDGLTHSFKAFLGKARVYQKVYPDCVIVVDKPLRDGKAISSRFDYYAKGIGLVAVETYNDRMKLIESESLALVEPGQ